MWSGSPTNSCPVPPHLCTHGTRETSCHPHGDEMAQMCCCQHSCSQGTVGHTSESLAHSRSGIWCREVGGPEIISEGLRCPLGFWLWCAHPLARGKVAHVFSLVVLSAHFLPVEFEESKGHFFVLYCRCPFQPKLVMFLHSSVFSECRGFAVTPLASTGQKLPQPRLL